MLKFDKFYFKGFIITLFQLILLIISLVFAYKFFEQVMNSSGEHIGQSDEEIIKHQQKSHAQMLSNRFNDLLVRADDDAYENNFDGAKKSLFEAVKIRPKHEDALMKLASVLLITKEYKEAQQFFQKVVNLNKHNYNAHKGLASALAQLKYYEQSAEHYKKALAINANDEITYYNYANLLQKMEKFKEARHHYRIALNINPDFQEAKTEYEKLSEKYA